MTTRRNFLKGLGLGLSAPLLYPLLQQVYAADPTRVPSRFVFFVEGNGIEPNVFLSDAAKSVLEQDTGATFADERYLYRRYKHEDVQEIGASGLSDALALGALKGGSGETNLEQEAAVILGLSSTITGGGHSTNFGALSSSYAPQSPTHPSIDHHLSLLPKVRQQSIFDVLRLGVGGSNAVAYDTCARGPGQIAPIIVSPISAFNKVFGVVAQGSGAKTFAQRARLLELARQDADRALLAFSGSSSERLKLENYLGGIDALITEQQALVARAAELRGYKPLEPGDPGALYDASCPLERMDSHVDLAISALRGQLTNVVVLGSGSGHRWGHSYPSLQRFYPRQEVVDRHKVCHSSVDPAVRTVLHEVNKRHVGMVARIARALQAEEEPGSPGDTMLDHTVIVLLSDNGEQHHSQAAEWPMLVLGGKKMGLRTEGRTLCYPALNRDKNRRVSDLFTTLDNVAGGRLDMAPMAGESRTTFGAEGPRRTITGPLAELIG